MNFLVELPASYLLSAKYWSQYGIVERQLDWTFRHQLDFLVHKMRDLEADDSRVS